MGDRKSSFQQTDELQLLHVGLLREYVALEFRLRDIQWRRQGAPPNPNAEPGAPAPANMERLIDDFVFMCFMLGNDFLPHLPTTDLDEDGARRALLVPGRRAGRKR